MRVSNPAVHIFQSFGEKIASIMERPGQNPVTKDDVPWWMKYAGRGLGTVGSISRFTHRVAFIFISVASFF